MNTGLALGISALLLVFNAYFVAAEFAVTSSRRSRVEPLVEEGNSRAKTVLWALEHVSLLLATCQLGVTLCSIGLGALAEPALAHVLMVPFKLIGLPAMAAHLVAVIVALLIVVYLHVVLGEMIPKNVTITYPEKLALVLLPSIVRMARVLHPVIWILNEVANLGVRLLRMQPKDAVSDAFSAQEVASIIEHSEAEGVLQDDLGLLAGVIDFTARTCAEVMVPGEKVICLAQDSTPEDLELAAAKYGFSRFPLVASIEEGISSVVGYLHIKDVLYASASQRQQSIPAWRRRQIAVVPHNMQADQALGELQKQGAHVSLVRDSAGQIIGILFLEDIIEEIVGEIRDTMQKQCD